ncbi:Uncharacterised protein [uncultured Ruminococcus sp.]|uniref:Uncharacterized protein n=1 Tax=Massiliimalia timonensis TaxID=1987501 RepID=A0A8J6TR16_9FIRM|nr:hypothetical protein [Massiliimalia timonensis]MBC8610091.1 hypothetical protein [Massiliimalia timonensis]MBS7176895.1 hypothetical protein [Clostridiales bacterium]SCH10717.1 Uncharacterised protein [uncultured Ruminococcus sp.]SCH78758.1 Uncharacterised protein [uncultured Clostridium sp.]
MNLFLKFFFLLMFMVFGTIGWEERYDTGFSWDLSADGALANPQAVYQEQADWVAETLQIDFPEYGEMSLQVYEEEESVDVYAELHFPEGTSARFLNAVRNDEDWKTGPVGEYARFQLEKQQIYHDIPLLNDGAWLFLDDQLIDTDSGSGWLGGCYIGNNPYYYEEYGHNYIIAVFDRDLTLYYYQHGEMS